MGLKEDAEKSRIRQLQQRARLDELQRSEVECRQQLNDGWELVNNYLELLNASDGPITLESEDRQCLRIILQKLMAIFIQSEVEAQYAKNAKIQKDIEGMLGQ